MPGSPFRALGLEPGPALTDDDVRAAWLRIAAATHPDRADGGDPDAFRAAAAAYADLRTAFGRGEALADLARPPRRRPARAGQSGRRPGVRMPWPATPAAQPHPAPAHPAPAPPAPAQARQPGLPAMWADRARRMAGRAWLAVARLRASRLLGGRPARLVLLVAAGTAVGAGAVATDGWTPASLAVIVAAATWVARAGHRYLGARPAATAAPEPGYPAPESPSPVDAAGG